jgi:hypothetical protein
VLANPPYGTVTTTTPEPLRDHDVPLHGFVIGGYTRDGDAEPGSRCKSDTALATVTRELEPHVATGPSGLGRRGESA